jgi:hypothetical protein
MFKGYQNKSTTTPNVEVSAGIRPAQAFVTASYLPTVRFDKKVEAYKTISSGKVVAVDKGNFLVPAGLAIDLETALAQSFDVDGSALSLLAQLIAIEAGTPGTFGNVYSATDVTEGVKNFAGDTVTAGEPVVASMLKSGAIDYKTADPATAVSVVTGAGFSKPLGILPYDSWQQNGAGYGFGYTEGNPNSYTYTNFNLQASVGVLTRYYIELPVVANTSGLILPGQAVFEGTPELGLVTFNKNSNFIMLPAIADIALDTTDTYADAAVNAAVNAAIAEVNKYSGRVLGRVYFIDDEFPKDMLDWVRTWNPNGSGFTALDKAPGTATAGLPDMLSYAGVTDPAAAKMVRINVNIAGQ